MNSFWYFLLPRVWKSLKFMDVSISNSHTPKHRAPPSPRGQVGNRALIIPHCPPIHSAQMHLQKQQPPWCQYYSATPFPTPWSYCISGHLYSGRTSLLHLGMVKVSTEALSIHHIGGLLTGSLQAPSLANQKTVPTLQQQILWFLSPHNSL